MQKFFTRKKYIHFSGYFLYLYGLIDYESTYALTHLRNCANAKISYYLYYAWHFRIRYFTLRSLKNVFTFLMLSFFPGTAGCNITVVPVQS